jgi:hypothetical protein
MPSATKRLVSNSLDGEGPKAHPDSGYMFSNSIWWLATGVPSPSNIRNLEEVVPQSMLPMNQSFRFPSSVVETPFGRCSWRSTAGGVTVSTCWVLGAGSGRFKASIECCVDMQ